MKLYIVKQGTDGFLIDNDAEENPITTWRTRKECDFTETVIDPIRLHNHPHEEHRTHLVELAKDGFAVFADWDNPRYLLAVPYNAVEIIC